MNTVKAQWGIVRSHGTLEWEENMLSRSVLRSAPQASDQAQQRTPLLYGPRGEVILERSPRPIGFRR